MICFVSERIKILTPNDMMMPSIFFSKNIQMEKLENTVAIWIYANKRRSTAKHHVASAVALEVLAPDEEYNDTALPSIDSAWMISRVMNGLTVIQIRTENDFCLQYIVRFKRELTLEK